MNKFTKKTIAGVALTVLGVSAIIGGTNAKYISRVTGNGNAQVAKWDFKVNGQTSSMQTINLLDTYKEETLVNGRIAPGTEGSFDLVIDAGQSEVGINYSVDLSDNNNKPDNLKFKLGNIWVDDINQLESTLSGIINANDSNRTRTLTVDWKWDYETGDETEINENDQVDTADGIEASNYAINVVVTGTQVQPQK